MHYERFRNSDKMALESRVRGGEYFCSSPMHCWHFTFLHAGIHFRHGEMYNTSMGEGKKILAPTGGF
jgi:hypothetical protein